MSFSKYLWFFFVALDGIIILRMLNFVGPTRCPVKVVIFLNKNNSQYHFTIFESIFCIESMKFYKMTSSPSKLRFAQKCIFGKWLCNVTKSIGRVYSVLKSSASSSKVCGNDCPRRSVQSGHMVVERGVTPLSAIIYLMKWGALQLPILSCNIFQCYLIIFQSNCANILNTWNLQTFPWM